MIRHEVPPVTKRDVRRYKRIIEQIEEIDNKDQTKK